MALDRLDVVIGDGSEESNRKWDAIRSRDPRLDVVLLIRIWLSDFPMNNMDVAVVLFTNPGSSSELIANCWQR
jgi:hypothetical protein